MDWLAAVERLRRDRMPAALVTLVSVRGHAPRAAGAKMVVTPDTAYGSIGGGNLEETAVERARDLIARGVRSPEHLELALNERAPVEHGQQCCGGEVSILLELHLVDSRRDRLATDRLAVLDDAVARVHVHHAPVPELVLGQVPAGTHVLIMTHDHAEDAALCDGALRCQHLGSVGMIGSSAKWRRFEKRLAAEGHSPDAVAGIRTPIGLPDLSGKEPAVIAVSVAADLLRVFESEAGAAVGSARDAGRLGAHR